MSYILSSDQELINTARALFSKAFKDTINTHSVAGESLVTTSRHRMYMVLLDRKNKVAIDGYSTTSGLKDAHEWITSNPAARTFFVTLAINFCLLLGHPSQARELCTHIGNAFAPDARVGEATAMFSMPGEINDRKLVAVELAEQLMMSKHLFAYTLFLLWADIDELSRNDEAYAAAAGRVRNSNVSRRSVSKTDQQPANGTAQ